ncbi:hypothetical protein F4819DRAFT_506846 [Hypoxylon fuscum]|nr:hypothetical protein F4819DRAFT_506846 [Hypoxylon fuscum]
MDSHSNSPAKVASVPVPPEGLVDGHKNGHDIAMSSPSEMLVDSAHSNSAEEISTVSMEDQTVSTLQPESMKDHETQESVAIRLEQPHIVVVGHNDSPASRDPTTLHNEPANEAPTTPHQGARSHLTATTVATTPSRLEVGVDYVDGVAIVEASTLCQEDLVEGIPSVFTPVDRSHSDVSTPTFSGLLDAVPTISRNRTRRRSSTPEPLPNISPEKLELQRECVFRNVVEGLREAWEEVLELCGMRLGCREAFHICYVPDVDHIRQAAMRPEATFRDIADAVELAMLEKWRERCRRIIVKYRQEMRRSLVNEAQRAAVVVKEKVLADAVNGKPDWHLPTEPPTTTPSTPTPSTPTPSTPTPSTPTPKTPNSKQKASKQVSELGNKVAKLNIEDDEDDSDLTLPMTPRTPRTPGKHLRVSYEPLYLPKGNTTPRRRQNGLLQEIPPRALRRRIAQTPAAAPAPTPDTHDVVGFIGPYAVVTNTDPDKSAAEETSAMDVDDDVFTSTKP